MKYLIFLASTILLGSLSASARYKAAGILPYTIRNGEILILLGKESRGNYPNTWSDFGGRREDADGNDSLKTALREFNEETRGTLQKPENIASPIIQRDSQKPNATYIMYPAEVPFLDTDAILHTSNGDTEKKEFKWVPWQTLKQIIEGTSRPLLIRPSFLKTLKVRPLGQAVSNCIRFFTELEKKLSNKTDIPE